MIDKEGYSTIAQETILFKTATSFDTVYQYNKILHAYKSKKIKVVIKVAKFLVPFPTHYL